MQQPIMGLSLRAIRDDREKFVDLSSTKQYRRWRLCIQQWIDCIQSLSEQRPDERCGSVCNRMPLVINFGLVTLQDEIGLESFEELW